MTIIHIHHLKCNKCNNHYRAHDLISFYDNGDGNAPNPNSEMSYVYISKLYID